MNPADETYEMILQGKIQPVNRNGATHGDRTPDPVDVRRSAIWKTADGRELSIHQMTDSHLANTMRLLQRKTKIVSSRRAKTLLHITRYTKLPLDTREILESIQHHGVHPARMFPIYTELEAEAKRRGLTVTITDPTSFTIDI